jgi:hypothetical protein
MENNKINQTLLFITSPLLYFVNRILSKFSPKLTNKIKLIILVSFSLLVFTYALLKIIN